MITIKTKSGIVQMNIDGDTHAFRNIGDALRFARVMKDLTKHDSISSCPCCGGKAEIVEDYGYYELEMYIKCTACGLQTPKRYVSTELERNTQKKRLINVWNRRSNNLVTGNSRQYRRAKIIDDERCVSCGAQIPEGRYVCPTCMNKKEMSE